MAHTKTLPTPAILAKTMCFPHTGSIHRWLNIDAPYSPDVVREFCGLLAADAERITDRSSCVAPRLCSIMGEPGLFVSMVWDEPGILKHSILPLSETVDQWRRRIADVASRHVIYGRG